MFFIEFLNKKLLEKEESNVDQVFESQIVRILIYKIFMIILCDIIL